MITPLLKKPAHFISSQQVKKMTEILPNNKSGARRVGCSASCKYYVCATTHGVFMTLLIFINHHVRG